VSIGERGMQKKLLKLAIAVVLASLIVVPCLHKAGASITSGKVLLDARSPIFNSQFGGYSGAISLLTSHGYTVDLFTTGTLSLSLLQQYCCLVIVCGDYAFSAGEISDILAFVNGGRGLLFLGEWGGKFTSVSGESIMSALGVTLNHDELRDPTDYATYIYWVNIHTFPVAHPVTCGIQTFRVFATGTFVVTSPATTIATGDDDSYAYPDPPGDTSDSAGVPGFEATPPLHGSFESILAVSSYGSGRAVIFGDSNIFASGNPDGINQADNRVLWMNIFAWLCPSFTPVIPETPIGTIGAAIAMVFALAGFAVLPRFRRLKA
jgi:hypothetical protein